MSTRSPWRIGQVAFLTVAIGLVLQPIGVGMLQVLTDAQRSPLLWHEGDGPCLELCTINATRFTQTVGVYSRFGGSHLGPIYFYWLAPFYVVLGRSATAMSFGVLALHFSSVLLLLAILLATFRRHGCRMIFVGSLLLAAYLRLIPLDSIWNPDVLALPFCLFLCAAALLGTGYSPAMPLVFLAGSFCIQTHLATTLCIAAVTGVSVVLFARRRAGSEEWAHRNVPGWIGLTGVVVLTVWLPPLVEEIHNSPGNLWKFAAYARSSSSEMGWFESAAILAGKVSWAPVVAKANSIAIHKGLLEGISWVLMALQVGAVVAVYYSKPVCGYCRSVAVVTAVAILSGFMTVVSIRMGAYDPLTDWLSAIGLVGYSLVVTACLPFRWRTNNTGIERPEGTRGYTKEMRYVLPALSAILVLVVTGTAVSRSFFWPGKVIPRGSSRVRDLSQELIGYLERKDFRRPQILTSPDRLKWRLTTGIGLELVKANRGFSLAVNRLGPDFRASRADDAVVLISDRPCFNEMCVTIASDVRRQSEASVARRDGDTFVSSLDVPPRISARRLADSLADLFGSPVRRLPAPLAERIWTLVDSVDAAGKLVYSVSAGSRRDQLHALQQVSVLASSSGVRIVSNGYSPRTMTESLDLRGGGVYFLVVDLSLDHDDLGQVFYGRASEGFSAEDSTAFPLYKGRNLVGILLPFPERIERIRFDPGHRPGSYTVAGFSIKEVSADTVLGR